MKLLLFIALFFTTQLFAQNANVTVHVSTDSKDKLANANIVITKFADSTVIQKLQTNTLGNATVSLDSTIKYFITVTSVGYAPIVKVLTITKNNQNINIELARKVKVNDGAVVVAKKPLIRQEDDKTIVDPENLVLTSTNAFEVLEKTPGIFADQDGNFFLASTTPATVQINGRDMRLSALDMATLIKSLPPDAIQRIEIVKTPSAKNDANSSGGVVNIVLKKGVKLGLTGSVSTGFQQGRYGNQFLSGSISNNTDKKTIYASAGLNKRTNFDELNSTRLFKVDTGLNQASFNKTNALNPYVNLGGSYMPNKNWDLAYDLNFSYTLNNNDYFNTNNIGKQSTNQNFTTNNNNTINDGNVLAIIQNINTKYKPDSGKIEWTANVGYNFFRNNNSQIYTINNLMPSAVQTLGDGFILSNRNMFTAQTDLIYKPFKKFTIETGIKNMNISFNNNTDFYKNGVQDNYRTNQFRYKENIAATYLQMAKTIEKIVIKGGVRLENTYMKGEQIIPSYTSFVIKRTDLFPYAFISRPLVKFAGFEMKSYLVYNKSISRPGYDLLNPFRKFVDNYLTEVGNPNLQPQFTEKFEANISVDNRPIFAVGQNRIKGIFTNVIYQNPANPAEALRTYDNLGRNTENYFQFTAAIPPGRKYFFVVGGQRNFNTYDGQYEGKPLKFSNKSWTFFTFHQYKIDKLSTISMQGFLQTGGLFQFYQLSDFGQLNFAINRYFYKNKLVVSLNLRDAFYTNRNDFVLLQGSVNANGSRVSDTRRFGLNIRYNFGIKKKKEENNDFNPDTQSRN
jgi:iron complex outermembrane recepter protein